MEEGGGAVNMVRKFSTENKEKEKKKQKNSNKNSHDSHMQL
jgi:hypothetical protein